MVTTLLESTIEQLDFKQGRLHDVSEPARTLGDEEWLNLGDWFSAAQKAGAEKIFFVDNNPVVVFARCGKGDFARIEAFNRLWCLSRPRILFLESEGELTVMDMAQPPVRFEESGKLPQLKTLATLKSIKAVSQKLQDFHRDHIESGKLFEQGRFGNIKNRADKALIADLKTVRRELLGLGLQNHVSYVHALIGRSIFIRYLEDRGILNNEYFNKIARGSEEWKNLLSQPLSKELFDFSGTKTFYPRVLQDKSFTYALFRQLSGDFNGDMFPDIDDEERVIEEKHLKLILDLLYGDAGIQKKLFFFSYRFDIIPLDLISAIYEEFYDPASDEKQKKKKARQDGAYYTPPVLAEFVCSRVLSPEILRQNPRILDPACGSGIFLVEAFRRIVRYRIKQTSEMPSFDELKQVLAQQIVGIEVNAEAARITAFSLYLAMLHYLDPPSIIDHIKKGNRLPGLIVPENEYEGQDGSIHVGNAFKIDIKDIDIVLGNPPWGDPGNKADDETINRKNIMLQWCQKRDFPIGNKEPSQAFLWRAKDFLKSGGAGALLVSAGVLFKYSSKSEAFRKKWMDKVCIKEVFNFTHVRKFYFKGANSPFLLIHFKKANQEKTPVEYWSLKQVSALKATQAILLTKYDRSFLIQQDLTDKTTWKINWFGRYADTIFIRSLSGVMLNRLIADNKEGCGRGYQTYEKKMSSKGLPEKTLRVIPERYGTLPLNSTPEFIYNTGPTDAYIGDKIIFNEGITEKGNKNGEILSRFEDTDFSFYRSVYGFKLKSHYKNDYLLIIGILWSSFARYFFFNTSTNWGLWYHKILLGELLHLLLPEKLSQLYSQKIVSIVNNLRDYHPQVRDITCPNGVPQEEIDTTRQEWETELDEAVFDLYDFTDEQRDLIRDCCEVTIPFFYQPYKSVGKMPAVDDKKSLWMLNYADRFAKRWQPYLNEDEVMRADLHIGASGNMVAMEFYPADIGDKWDLTPRIDSWGYVLEEIGKNLPHPMGTSQILLDGIVHIVSDNSIIVIKRNEKRFWTRSLAREDADSTLVKAMKLEIQPNQGGA